MLTVRRSGNIIHVETGSSTFEWDMRRGGQLVRCDLKSPGGSHPMLGGDEPAPNLTMEVNGRRVSLADVPAEFTVLHKGDQSFIFTTRSRVAGVFTVEQRYDVFREGVMFCEFGISLDKGRKVKVRNAAMGFTLDVAGARNMRGNYINRDPYLKQDVTCVHVLATMMISRDRNEKIDIEHLVPVYGLDLGWDDSRYFSNKFEMVLEDSTSFGGAMLAPTRTVAGPRGKQWELKWVLSSGSEQVIKAPFLYRNKWGLFCGSARSEAGKHAEPTRRNNVMGARVCHVMYPYVRDVSPAANWPWCSVPIRQTFYQDVQLAKENPSLKRIDEAAREGANLLVLHQFWMNNGGSNGEPMADYKVADPRWFKAVIDRAHRHGMRVCVYMRGIEHYSLYMDFFEKYLKKDHDGLYVDWASPFGIGYVKTSTKHFPMYNWFMFARALRARVGEGGFLIGHSALQTAVSYATFDATLTGEFSVLHTGLLAEPEVSASYSGLGCAAVHIMAGNSPDRAMFSSQRAAALSVGLGYGNHPFMEPGKPFGKCCAYIKPYWNLMRALGAAPVRLFSPAIGTGKPLSWDNNALHPIAYQAADGTTLVLIANLGEKTVDGSTTVDLAGLGLKASARLKPLRVAGTHTADVRGNKIILRQMKPFAFCGLLATKV